MLRALPGIAHDRRKMLLRPCVRSLQELHTGILLIGGLIGGLIGRADVAGGLTGWSGGLSGGLIVGLIFGAILGVPQFRAKSPGTKFRPWKRFAFLGHTFPRGS